MVALVHVHREAASRAKIGVDWGLRVAFVHDSPPNPPISQNPPMKNQGVLVLVGEFRSLATVGTP